MKQDLTNNQLCAIKDLSDYYQTVESRGSVLLQGGTGSGKSRTIISFFENINKDNECGLLVVVPFLSLTGEWQQQFEQWSTEKKKIVHVTTKNYHKITDFEHSVFVMTMATIMSIFRGPNIAKRKRDKRIYDRNVGVKNILLFVKYLKCRCPNWMVVFDESHVLRNGITCIGIEEEKRITYDAVEFTMRNIAPTFFICMSATHRIKRHFDLFPLMCIMKPELKKRLILWRKYEVETSKKEKKRIKRKIGDDIKKIACVVLHAPECKDMKVHFVTHDMTEEEKKVYLEWSKKFTSLQSQYAYAFQQMQRHAISRNDFVRIQNLFLAELMRGKRGAIVPRLYGIRKRKRGENETIVDVEGSKIKKICECIQDIRKKSTSPVLILGKYTEPLVSLHTFLSKETEFKIAPCVHEGKNKTNNAIMRSKFNKGDYDILIGTRGSIGTGSNITGEKDNPCLHLVCVDTETDLAIEKQHRGRIMRPLAQGTDLEWHVWYILHQNHVAELQGKKSWINSEFKKLK